MHNKMALVVFALVGCDAGGPEEYAAALPDDRVRIDMPSAAVSGDRSVVGEPAEYAALTAQVTGDVNGLIGSVLDTVATVTSFDPTWSDGEQTALWGPWEDGGIRYALWVTHDEAEGLYSWGIDAESDASHTIVAGQADDNASEAAYSGWFVVDFDAIAAVSPDETARGLFASAYDVDGDVVIATAAFEAFSDGGEPVNAVYQYTQTVGQDGQLDLVYESDVTGNGQDELSLIRSRWAVSGAGRADALLTGGELGALSFTAAECWGADHRVTFYEDNYSLSRSGEESDCAFAEPSFSEDAR